MGPKIYRTVFLGLPMARYFEWATYISGMLTSHPIIAKNIYLSYKNKTGKMRPFCDAIRPLIPLFGLFALSSVWVFLSQNSIVWVEPRVIFMCFGTVFSNFTVSTLIEIENLIKSNLLNSFQCRLIVAQMSGTKADAWNSQLTLLGLVTCVCVFPYRSLGVHVFTLEIERWILFGLTAVCTLGHIHYGASVVIEMCNHFNIKCFRVRDQLVKLKEGEHVPLIKAH